MPLSPRQTRPAAALAALALAASLGPGIVTGAVQADDPSCVGKAEYRKIKGGMSIQQLAALLDGQTPFADLEGSGRQRVRWYSSCETWQPVKDVVVRYHKPVVGRRTVAGKKLDVYEESSQPGGGPREPSGSPRPPR